MANQQRQFSVTNNPKSQGCVPMPEMGGSLSCGVSDTAVVPAVLQRWPAGTRRWAVLNAPFWLVL